MPVVTKAVFRSAGISWQMTAPEALKAVWSICKRGHSMRIVMGGAPGTGKSTFLEWLSLAHTELAVIEGDIVTILARWMLCPAYNKELPLFEAVRIEINGKTLWDWLPEGLTKDEVFSEALGTVLDRIDFSSSRGYESRALGIMVPDYRGYVANYRRRTKVMMEDALKKGETAWAEHIQRNHGRPLSFEELNADIVTRCGSSRKPIHFVPNSYLASISKQWERVVDTLVKTYADAGSGGR